MHWCDWSPTWTKSSRSKLKPQLQSSSQCWLGPFEILFNLSMYCMFCPIHTWKQILYNISLKQLSVEVCTEQWWLRNYFGVYLGFALRGADPGSVVLSRMSSRARGLCYDRYSANKMQTVLLRDWHKQVEGTQDSPGSLTMMICIPSGLHAKPTFGHSVQRIAMWGELINLWCGVMFTFLQVICLYLLPCWVLPRLA